MAISSPLPRQSPAGAVNYTRNVKAADKMKIKEEDVHDSSDDGEQDPAEYLNNKIKNRYAKGKSPINLTPCFKVYRLTKTTTF